MRYRNTRTGDIREFKTVIQGDAWELVKDELPELPQEAPQAEKKAGKKRAVKKDGSSKLSDS